MRSTQHSAQHYKTCHKSYFPFFPYKSALHIKPMKKKKLIQKISIKFLLTRGVGRKSQVLSLLSFEEASLAVMFGGCKWWPIHCSELFKAQALRSDTPYAQTPTPVLTSCGPRPCKSSSINWRTQSRIPVLIIYCCITKYSTTQRFKRTPVGEFLSWRSGNESDQEP